jgi:hypothetical protein
MDAHQASDEGMISVAWLYKPFGSKLGILQLAEGQLYFILSDGTTVFDAPLADFEFLGWPSYGIAPDSQVKLRVGGKKHRVCFVAPNNAPEVTSDGEAAMFGATAAAINNARRAWATYDSGMKTGAVWHEQLDP